MNHLAVQMGEGLNAGVPFYGAAAKSEDVSKIKASLLVQYAEDDGINHNESLPSYACI